MWSPNFAFIRREYFDAKFKPWLDLIHRRNESATLTLCVWEAVVRQFPLDQHSYEAESRPDAQNDPAVPAERLSGCEAQAFIHVHSQNQHLHKVIGTHCHDGRPKHSGGQHGEHLLPLQCQHGKQHARSQKSAQRHPQCGRCVELLSDQQGSESQEEAEQQARHEEADASHEHSDEAAQEAYTEADARAGLDAQLRVQHVLLVAQQENDDRAKHQARQEHDSFETPVTWRRRAHRRDV